MNNIVENTLDCIDYAPLIRKNSNTNKGDFGTVAIIGGNSGMLGSIYLAGRAAMLMGAGKVVLAPLSTQLHAPVDIVMPELMIVTLEDVLVNLNKFTVVVVGSGFGTNDHAIDVLTRIIDYPHLSGSKLIFDADALNIMATHQSLKAKFINLLPFNKVITPHVGEAMRLLGLNNTCDIQNDRVDAVQKLSNTYKSIALLKGSGSLIYHPQADSIIINKTGNQALSNAGQGDTLCGLIAGLTAQGVTLLTALQFAVYLQGLAADELVLQYGGYNGILATDVALNCRKFLNKILYNIRNDG
jgi:hydroxyethylthiazole kinase-like uncharacterized protein yjeF